VPKKERGQSHSTRPLGRRSPSWCRYTAEEVEALVIKLAREGNPPSRIGTVLRDQYGIPLAKAVVGKGVYEILKANNLAATVPEDLEALLRKSARLRSHLGKNKSDRYGTKSLQIVEAKIHRLSEYYKREGLLPRDWKYTPTVLAIT